MRRLIPDLLRNSGKTGFVVVAAFLVLVGALAWVIRESSRPPVIESISPEIGVPGDTLLIQGHNFGNERGRNRVYISGRAPTASAHLDWSNNQVRIRVPGDTASGLVYVVTSNGRSNGLLFTNREHVPEPVAAVSQPGRPVITSIEPTLSRIGNTVTISGRRFGENRKNSRVLFSWNADGIDNPGAPETRSGLIAGSVADFVYEAWSDRRIRVRIPDGAVSGPVYVETDKGRSPPIDLQLERPVGSKVYHGRRSFAVQYEIEIDQIVIDAERGSWNRLYIWVPRVQHLAEQPNPQVVTRVGPSLFDDVSGLAVFELSNVQPGESHRIARTVLFDRYAIETRIDANRVPVRYAVDSRFLSKYLAENAILPVGDTAIANTARQVSAGTQNPYVKAQRLYNWVLDRLTPEHREASRRPLEAMQARSGNSYSYATLYTALLRAAGVPARLMAGYLFDAGQQPLRHYWTEFFLQDFGWVPTDPALGDGLHAERLEPRENPRAFYFGNLDAGRVVFSPGLLEARNLHADGVRRSVRELYSLQTRHEEAVGNLVDYRSRWYDLRLLGEYD
ncbi:MAG: hypothetical protein EA384_03870 [Spirochaetaceae bacterium]|nr:MAG: hypothetical protein EA384_03870 [Spirochaetaceae bacterium]